MALSAEQVITGALQLIRATGDEEPVEAFDSQRGIDILNDLMAELETADEIDLDYTTITTLTDEVTVVDGAYKGIKALLAVELWPYSYQKDPPGILVSKAVSGKKALLKIGFSVDEADFPNTLPVGSGNYNITWNTFFPVYDDD